jgi:hypothetical protein
LLSLRQLAERGRRLGDEARHRIEGLVDDSATSDRGGPGIFVSYRKQAGPGVAHQLVQNLRRQRRLSKFTFFLDEAAIPPGAEWVRVITDRLAASEATLLVIGPGWNEGDRLAEPENFVRREIELARELHLPVIPVITVGAELPPRESLPPALGWLHDTPGVALYNETLAEVITDNLGRWLVAIVEERKRTVKLIERADKDVRDAEAELERAKTAQAVAERAARDADDRVSALTAQLPEAESELAQRALGARPTAGAMRVHICHEPDASDEAARLVDELGTALGSAQITDTAPADAGADVRAAAEGRVADCDVLLALIGPEWPETGGTATGELELALARRVVVFPILVRRLKEPTAESLPEGLRSVLDRQVTVLRREFWAPAVRDLVAQLEQIERTIERQDRELAAAQTRVEQLKADAERAAREQAKARDQIPAVVTRVAESERRVQAARAHVKQLKETPKDENPAFVAGPPEITTAAG